MWNEFSWKSSFNYFFLGNKKSGHIKYAFLEFGTEAVCESAKDHLASNPEFYVDFVGLKSKSKKANSNAKQNPINPTRLHVSGLQGLITEAKLKALFPKSVKASIPKGKSYGFVQFQNPADAKAAYDAAQKLKVEKGHLTVVFARLAKQGEVEKAEEGQVQKKRQNKGGNETATKKAKMQKEESDPEEEDGESESEEQKNDNEASDAEDDDNEDEDDGDDDDGDDDDDDEDAGDDDDDEEEDDEDVQNDEPESDDD